MPLLRSRFHDSLIVATAISCCCLSITSHSQTLPQTQWNRFRGPNGRGIAADAKPPVTFDQQTNLQWSTDLPEGYSSPVIWSDRIFVTGVQKDAFETICVDRERGEILWRQPGPQVELEPHNRNTAATPTPFVDEDRVYVYFGSYGLLCYDHRGEELWKLLVRTPSNIHGTATSPVGYRHLLYLIHDSIDGDSYVLAVEKSTGHEVWKARRPLHNPNWSTPLIWQRESGDELIVLGGGMVQAYEPLTGEVLWSVAGFGHPIPSPVVGDKFLYASTASGEEAGKPDRALRWEILRKKYDMNADGRVHVSEIPETDFMVFNEDLPEDGFPTRILVSWFDRDQDQAFTQQEVQQFLELQNLNVRARIAAIRPTVERNGGEERIAWTYERSIPRNSSCLAVQGKIYMFNDGGVVTCLDAESGRLEHQSRVGRGHYWSSPIYANGHIYICSSEGVVTVLQVGVNLKIVSANDLSELIVATPAICDGAILVRTQSHLYAFSEKASH